MASATCTRYRFAILRPASSMASFSIAETIGCKGLRPVASTSAVSSADCAQRCARTTPTASRSCITLLSSCLPGSLYKLKSRLRSTSRGCMTRKDAPSCVILSALLRTVAGSIPTTVHSTSTFRISSSGSSLYAWPTNCQCLPANQDVVACYSHEAPKHISRRIRFPLLGHYQPLPTRANSDAGFGVKRAPVRSPFPTARRLRAFRRPAATSAASLRLRSLSIGSPASCKTPCPSAAATNSSALTPLPKRSIATAAEIPLASSAAPSLAQYSICCASGRPRAWLAI